MKEMTDESKKIVDALRRCDEQGCDGCPYDGTCSTPGSEFTVERDAADLIERLSEELEQVKRERDAAIHDVGIALHCVKCKYDGRQFKNVEPCNKCIHNWRGKESQWQWRGVCAENSGGGKE